MSIYDYTVKDRKGNDISIGDFKGKVLIPVVKAMDKDYKNNPDIKWNFTKFLVDREGNVVDRFEPTITPEKIEVRIKELL